MKADFKKGTKVCSRCKRELPISEFGTCKKANDGLNFYCKECYRTYTREYRNENKIVINKRSKEWAKNNDYKYQKLFNKRYGKTDRGKEARKKSLDKIKNVHQRSRKDISKRGIDHTILKRDYELTKEQLKRRNYNRKHGKNEKSKQHAIMIWYDEDNTKHMSKKQYTLRRQLEYNRQKRCAICGYIGRKNPSKYFLFDFDLEQMLKDNVYSTVNGNGRKYITKWWKGQIRHWTVNDGIWKE